MTYIFDAGTQGRKVRFLAWLAIAGFLGSLVAAADALNGGDFGGAALFAGAGAAFPALIFVFLDHYASGISIDFKAGETYTIKHHVRAPYIKLRLRGRRWPFIIDMQGFIADEAGFERLLSGIGAPAKKKKSKAESGPGAIDRPCQIVPTQYLVDKSPATTKSACGGKRILTRS